MNANNSKVTLTGKAQLIDICMLTKRTGMFVLFANRSKAEVHSFTCHTLVKCHAHWNQHFISTKKEKEIANALLIAVGRGVD